jgi:hypothetical protein
MFAQLRQFKFNYKIVFILYCAFCLFATSQSYFLGNVTNEVNGREYTRYNNYIIFKQSFYHLVHQQDIYDLYPEEQWDLYKYSPAFSLFFGVFAILPNYFGLLAWNLLNALALFLAVRYLPGLSEKIKILVLLTVLLELLTSLQSEQSNGLMAALIILAFGLLERNKYFWAAFCLVCSIYIKLFGLVALALYLFYPQKWRLAVYTLFWLAVLALVPLLVVPVKQLVFLYQSWREMLAEDHYISDGFSVMGWLKTWFNLELPKMAVLLVGVGLFCAPLLRFRQYSDYFFRLLLLCSVLLWVIIFNHKAESPTFIIAMCGVALWYLPQERSKVNLTLFILAIIFTNFAPTDIFPKVVRDQLFKPYVVKVVPCILIWLKISYELLFGKYQPQVEEVPELVAQPVK